MPHKVRSGPSETLRETISKLCLSNHNDNTFCAVLTKNKIVIYRIFYFIQNPFAKAVSGKTQKIYENHTRYLHFHSVASKLMCETVISNVKYLNKRQKYDFLLSNNSLLIYYVVFMIYGVCNGIKIA